ncbi:hypothetical protein AWJ20_2001 [Sugiyamaella lignohabitans]|uniref:RSE1/DDB1/CPSF1 second beta-propeller domain-containing protein n=1 Tax=Sugiyamaella lignohabitans TaxID=796027 RepID=A0A167ESQ9_9ASCO|nr:uncharacterized protein AWJ20_2001 [Sugiyamaella lignohabitans]ANB14413.1 hypothetical protein AWJ20_2001 [Sugiyamaella lignohabitans]
MGQQVTGANDLGLNIAVESHGRFIAVSDSNKRVRIMAFGLSDDNSLASIIDSRQDIQSRHTISIGGGVVLNMAFLTTGSTAYNTSTSMSPKIAPVASQGDPRTTGGDDVYLVLLYAVSRKLKLNMYKVPYGQREFSYIHDIGLCGTFTLSLDFKEEIPMYMVPVSMNESSAIVLVTKRQLLLVTFLDIMSGHRILTSALLPDYPLAVHQSPYNKDRSVFYLTTKDSHLYRVKVSEMRGFELLSFKHWPGRDLGSSFVLQPYDDEGPTSDINSDRLLITFGGDLCCGGSMVFNSVGMIYDDGEQADIEEEGDVDIYDNWAPISDFKPINIQSTSRGDSLELFACTGLHHQGAITQFRHGIRASVFLQGPSMTEAPQLYSMQSHDGLESYLIVSLPWKTTLYLVEQSTIDEQNGQEAYFPQLSEVPNNCGIDYKNETKAISFLPETKFVIQVTSSQILLTDLMGSSKRFDVTRASCAAIFKSMVAVAFYDEDALSNKVVIYSINSVNYEDGDNWIERKSVVLMSHPVSFVKFTERKDNGINLFIGSYEPRIDVYHIDNDCDARLVLEIKNIFTDEEEVPNDLHLQDRMLDRFIIGLRNGSYINCVLEDMTMRLESKKKLANLPIQFVNIDHKPGPNVFVLSNGRLSCFDKKNFLEAPQKVVVDIDKVADIRSACQFYYNMEDGKHQFVAVIMNNRLTILALDLFATVIPKQVHLGASPRRMLYLEHIGALAVVVSPSSTSKTSLLRFVDPKRMVEIDFRLYDATSPSSKTCFQANEVIYSLNEWSLKIDGNTYKFLLLGSGIKGLPEGKFRILRLSRTTEGIKATIQHSWITAGHVYSVSQFEAL